MKAASFHQILAGFSTGDAISQEALALRSLCRELDFQSEIFAPADRIAPDAVHECHPLGEYRQDAGDIALCHYSIASAATDAFLSSPARKVMIYHNITPAEFYAPFDDVVTKQLSEARTRLKETARRAHAVWADSAFNASELRSVGIENAKVFPLLFSPAAMDVTPDPAVLQQFEVPMKNILFVGRVAPNKCIEELITSFAWLQRKIEPYSRLIIVGSDCSAPAYFAMLQMYVAELDLPNVLFQRFASPSGLAACYQKADVFVTASRHEGYCLPLVEAMYKGIPVVARNTGGTPEAMDNAGVLYDELKPPELAELLAILTRDGDVRRTVLDSQKERVQEILRRPVREEFLSLLSGLIPAG